MLDAPPTGRITRFLNVNAEVAGLARMGPVRTQADTIMKLLHSPETAVHLVTLLEEMPVQETADAIAELTAVGLPVGAVVVNMLRRPPLRATDLTAAAKGKVDRATWSPGSLGRVVRERHHGDRPARRGGRPGPALSLEKRERKVVAALQRPTYELDWLPDGVHRGGLFDLAGHGPDPGRR